MTSINRALLGIALLVAAAAATYFSVQRKDAVAPKDTSNVVAVTPSTMAAPHTSAVIDPQRVVATAEAKWSPKVNTLIEVLNSRNDNDPRLDTDFKNLSEAEKAELRTFYHSLPGEDRNGRGTTVFLLSRNIKTKEDLEFFKEVINEPPCFSLTDCDMAEDPVIGQVDEHDGSQAITLVYPQLVAIKSIERLGKSMNEVFKESAEDVLAAGEANINPRIRNAARAVKSALGIKE